MAKFRNATVLDAINAAGSLTGDVSNYGSQIIKDKAESDLRYMSAQYQEDANTFLDNMQRSGDYENWEQNTDSWLEDEKNKFLGQAKNGYTSKLVDQMITSYRPGLRQTVQQRIFTAQTNDIVTTDNMTIELNHKNLSGQACFDADKSVYDSEYTKGFIDSKAYSIKLQNSAQFALKKIGQESIDKLIPVEIQEGKTGLTESYLNDLDNSIDLTYIHSSMANNEILKKLKETNPNVEGTYDIETVKKDLQNYYKTNYQIQLQNYQSKNEQKVDQLYSQCSNDLTNLILGTGDVDEKTFYTRLKYGSDLVTNTMGGNKMSKGTQSQYVDHFRSLLNAYTSWSKAGGSTNAGSDKQTESLKTYLSNRTGEAAKLITDGSISYSVMTGAFQSMVYDELMENPWKENENGKMSASERQQVYDDTLKNYASINILNDDKVINLFKKNYPEAGKAYEKALDLINKHKVDYTPEAAKYLMDSVLLVAQNTDNDVSQADVEKQVMTNINAVMLTGLNNVTKFVNYDEELEGNESLLQEQKKRWSILPDENEEKYAARIASQLEEEDLVIPDQNGNAKEAPNTEERFSRVKDEQLTYIAKALDMDPQEAAANFTVTHKAGTAVEGAKLKNDYKSPFIFTNTSTGKRYAVEPVKTGDKATSIQVIDADSGTIVADGSKIFGKKTREEKKADNAAVTAEQKAQAAETKAIHTENVETDKKEIAARNEDIMQQKAIPSVMEKAGVDKRSWELESNLTNRQILVTDTVSKLDRMSKSKKDKDKFRLITGIDPEVWKAKSQKEKENIVLGK